MAIIAAVCGSRRNSSRARGRETSRATRCESRRRRRPCCHRRIVAAGPPAACTVYLLFSSSIYNIYFFSLFSTMLSSYPTSCTYTLFSPSRHTFLTYTFSLLSSRVSTCVRSRNYVRRRDFGSLLQQQHRARARERANVLARNTYTEFGRIPTSVQSR